MIARRQPGGREVLALAGALALSNVVTVGAYPKPKMQDALTYLQSVEQTLQQASPDKGGHRVKAIDLTKQAIEEVKEGIKFDNNH